MTKRRQIIDGLFYHVTMHGHNRLPIFQTEADQKAFFRVLDRVYEKYPFTLLAYCIMPNHYHLLIRPDRDSLSKVMASINLMYSISYKKRHTHKGTIYDRKFFSKPALTPRVIIEMSAYIHRNPINMISPIATTPESYLYSSYRYYHHPESLPPSYLDKELLYSFMPDHIAKNIHGYKIFMAKPVRLKNKNQQTNRTFLIQRYLSKR